MKTSSVKEVESLYGFNFYNANKSPALSILSRKKYFIDVYRSNDNFTGVFCVYRPKFTKTQRREIKKEARGNRKGERR